MAVTPREISPEERAQARGTLMVVMRRIDLPDSLVDGVSLHLADHGDTTQAAWGRYTRDRLWRYNPSSGRVAQFDSIPARTYTLRLRRIGFDESSVDITIGEHCTVRVEAFLVLAMLNHYHMGPRPPARFDVSSCTRTDPDP